MFDFTGGALFILLSEPFMGSVWPLGGPCRHDASLDGTRRQMIDRQGVPASLAAISILIFAGMLVVS